MSGQNSVVQKLMEVARKYPEDMVDAQILDIPRIAFNVDITLNATDRKSAGELEVCDLGGGVGMFSVGCAANGFKRTVLVDDFRDSINLRRGSSLLDLHRSYGVEVASRDVVAEGMRDIEGTFDVITTFDSMEHWHNSPKKLFGEALAKLKPGGALFIGVPNCVNLRKRITVPFGKGKWSAMQDWYEAETFRGHVREPDVGDLQYIARDLGLENVKIFGRNWMGLVSGSPLFRIAAKITDYPLRMKPSFCSDIYLLGRKP